MREEQPSPFSSGVVDLELSCKHSMRLEAEKKGLDSEQKHPNMGPLEERLEQNLNACLV